MKKNGSSNVLSRKNDLQQNWKSFSELWQDMLAILEEQRCCSRRQCHMMKYLADSRTFVYSGPLFGGRPALGR